MSVYQRTNAAGETRFRYDFQFAGQRHLSAEPHYATKAKAEKAERDERKRLARGGGASKRSSPGPAQVESRNSPLASSETQKNIVTLKEACDRFWRDVGQRHRSASDIRRRLDIVCRIIGADPKVAAGGIAAIGTGTVIAAVQVRMNEETLTRWGKPSGRKVSGQCANRDVIDQLRPVLNHAGVVWEDELELRAIKWKLARQAEADEQICEFTAAEIVAWGEALSAQQQRYGRDGATERAFLTLALEYGPRLGELFFAPDSFRPDAPDGAELELGRYTGKGGVVRESRKDGSLHAVPLRAETVALLAPFVARALEIGAPTVWLEPGSDGEPVPISYDAMRYRLLAAARKAGIEQSRIIHGMRHHAGSAMNREGGLALVQSLLGHKQVTTSRRYAHTKKADTRAALEQIQAKKSRPSPAQNGAAENGAAR